MSEQNKEEIQSITRFDEINENVSLTIAKEVYNCQTEELKSYRSKEQGSKIVIYIGKESIVTIPGTFFNSLEEAIKEINEVRYNLRQERKSDLVDDLFDILVVNIREWSQNHYDTRLLCYKIAFPLLKKLKEVGETKFQVIFQQEILKNLASGNLQIKEFLDHEGYLQHIRDFF